MTLPKRSWVEISLGAIASNYRAICDLTGPRVTVAAVVKADAYRHGAVEIARVLEREGAAWLAVSNAEEGVELREAGVQARILVMADGPHVADLNLTPVIHSLDALAEVKPRTAYHLKLDTGMGRLGTREPAAVLVEAIRKCPGVLEGLMTHFASSADYIGLQTEEQMADFAATAAALRAAGSEPQYLHACSTIPIAYGRRGAWHNMVRPGMALYGYVSPARGDAPPCELRLTPALTWRASVLEVKDVPKGAHIGYGAGFITPRPMRIGILALGYADGLPHRLSGRGRMIAAGAWAPILGAVSMDLTTIDLSAAPQVKRGDGVTILGGDGELVQDAQMLAREAGTISYSLLCGIHERVRRVYVA
ncbi:MAG: alanine racemase [Acidobacteriota bacterium]